MFDGFMEVSKLFSIILSNPYIYIDMCMYNSFQLIRSRE